MTTGKRNPKWNRDELALTVELYFKNLRSRTSTAIIRAGKLPEELRRLRESLGKDHSDTFRNASGVYQKMQNFVHLDPDCKAKGQRGRPNGGHWDKEVWDESYNKRAALKKACQFLREKMKGGSRQTHKSANASVPAPGPISALEGEPIEHWSYRHKRDLRLRRVALDNSEGVCAICDLLLAASGSANGASREIFRRATGLRILTPGRFLVLERAVGRLTSDDPPSRY